MYNNKDITKVRNKINGDCGEIQAANYLKNKGYKIVTTNYKIPLGEIDIIALKDGVIVFVEVKKRETLAFGRPCEAVGFSKQQKIRKVAEYFLMKTNKYENDVRFDVIEIVGDKITHLEDAF